LGGEEKTGVHTLNAAFENMPGEMVEGDWGVWGGDERAETKTSGHFGTVQTGSEGGQKGGKRHLASQGRGEKAFIEWGGRKNKRRGEKGATALKGKEKCMVCANLGRVQNQEKVAGGAHQGVVLGRVGQARIVQTGKLTLNKGETEGEGKGKGKLVKTSTFRRRSDK